MKRHSGYLSALFLFAAASIGAQDIGRVMSVPTASSADGIYKVRIESINGRAVADELWYMLTPGEHLIGVSLMLDIQWTPETPADAVRPRIHELLLAVEGGKTYQLAARVDVNAPPESVTDGSFWQPFVLGIDDN